MSFNGKVPAGKPAGAKLNCIKFNLLNTEYDRHRQPIYNTTGFIPDNRIYTGCCFNHKEKTDRGEHPPCPDMYIVVASLLGFYLAQH